MAATLRGNDTVRMAGAILQDGSTILELEKLLLRHRLQIDVVTHADEEWFVRLRGQGGRACGLRPSLHAAFAEAFEEYFLIPGRPRRSPRRR